MTKPLAPLPTPGSEAAASLEDLGQPLILPRDEIIDADRILNDIMAACEIAGEAADVRKITVRHLAAAKLKGNAILAGAFEVTPKTARALVAAQVHLTDALVRIAYRVALGLLHHFPDPSTVEDLCVCAVGGYGRAEMAPHSDVDLLFLTPAKATPWAGSVIESMLYILWDLKLKVGHSTRTVLDCVRLGSEDVTIRTSLLEQRFIVGHFETAQALDRKLWSDLFKGTGAEFIEAKLKERAERHKRQGGQRYVLEPNVKEGKGGLRDLQTLYWIGKYLHRVQSAEGLVKAGLLAQDEFLSFARAEDFLWTVRCHLHYLGGRAVDQLTFDMQVEVAARMGYLDGSGRRAVEFFMQDYFRQATKVGELTRVFLTELEARHVKKAAGVIGFFKRNKKLRYGFHLVQGRIDTPDAVQFLAEKRNVLRIFAEALRTGYLLHPNVMRLIAGHLDLIDDDLRNDPEAIEIFMDLLLKHGNPERGLRRMNELGVLGAFIPEFEAIVAMMQFNVYHHYTVDEHTIQTISALAQIERGELIEELPLVSGIMAKEINRKVIFVALLLHDIGKGRPEDHSILGARLARRICPRLGLTPDESETVEWLIRYHLLMSDMAQKRDVSDPRTVRDFAKAVKTSKRLDLITVLTVCDIRGVGPATWNNWKAMLLRQLYSDTAMALENGLESINREHREEDAKAHLLLGLSDWKSAAVETEIGRHYAPYWQGLSTESHLAFAGLLRDLGEAEIRVALRPDPDRDATRACFALVDHPGIFSRLAGALALVGANIVDARTYTSKDGFATAAFWIQDADGKPYEAAKLPRMSKMIDRTLAGEVLPREAFADRDKVKKRESAFRFPTHIMFDNEGSDIYTIIEVDTRDRPGLLFDLTRTLAGNNIYIASAVIATFGAQVVDTFYVKDMFGLKLHAKSRQEALDKKLRQAILDGVKRANL